MKPRKVLLFQTLAFYRHAWSKAHDGNEFGKGSAKCWKVSKKKGKRNIAHQRNMA